MTSREAMLLNAGKCDLSVEYSRRWSGSIEREPVVHCVRIDGRPLVVIDPEESEQVERLTSAVMNRRVSADWSDLLAPSVEQVQAALRSLIAPPKPDEPTGLGAVVEVESNRTTLKGLPMRLVRTHATHQPWSGDNQKRDWDEIEGSVTILSEGVA